MALWAALWLIVLFGGPTATQAHLRALSFRDETYGGVVREVWQGTCEVDGVVFHNATCIRAEISHGDTARPKGNVGLWVVPEGWVVQGAPSRWEPGVHGVFRTINCQVYSFEWTRTEEEALRYIEYQFCPQCGNADDQRVGANGSKLGDDDD